MVFAGLQKHSLIDYPGKVSCVAFVTGCNFQCPYCHNPDLARGNYPQRISEKAFLAFLTPRLSFLDGVVVTGGEPTLQPGLAELCRTLGAMGLAVKLDTNGSRPDVLLRLIECSCIDSIAMDLKTDLQGYGPPLCRKSMGAEIEKSIRIIMDSGLDYEFRTTCAPPFVDEARMGRMACSIRGAKRYILQACNPGDMLDADFFNGMAPRLSEEQMTRLRQIAAPLVASCGIR